MALYSDGVTADELKSLSIRLNICSSLQNNSLDLTEILEEVELAFEALHALDSNVRIPLDIFCDLFTAKRIQQNNV